MLKFYKNKNNLVVEIPLSQSSYDASDEFVGRTDNLIGIIAGQEYSISQLIDLGYKGDQQEGMPIIMLNDEEELRKVCKDFNIQIWKHELCAYCGEVIRGSCTWGDKGVMCYKCDLEGKK